MFGVPAGWRCAKARLPFSSTPRCTSKSTAPSSSVYWYTSPVGVNFLPRVPPTGAWSEPGSLTLGTNRAASPSFFAARIFAFSSSFFVQVPPPPKQWSTIFSPFSVM